MPTLTIFAGINGAGKTTLYKSLTSNKNNNNFGLRLNIDEQVVKMNGDNNSFSDNAKATRIVLDKIFYCINNKISFNWETTIFSYRTIKIIQAAKECDFNINIHFVAVNDVDLAIKRINIRKNNGGHFVHKHMVVGRHSNQFKNFNLVANLVNNFYIYENQEKLERIANFENGKFNLSKNCEWIKPYLTNLSTEK